jgi:serine/threonine-protein kinase RsbW
VIRVKIPARLEYRDLAMRMVASACKLVSAQIVDPRTGESRPDHELDAQVVSAFGEAFNNVALHSYRRQGGDLEIEIETGPHALVIRIMDQGEPFDLATVPLPDLDTLPESGLGLYIMRACMDEVTYVPGPPNVLTMTRSLIRTQDGDAVADRNADE